MKRSGSFSSIPIRKNSFGSYGRSSLLGNNNGRASLLGSNNGRSSLAGSSIKTPRSKNSKPTPTKQSRLSSTYQNIRKSSVKYDAMRDVRNLSEPVSKEAHHRILLTFLTANNYPHLVTYQSLNSPKMKDFVNIFEFLCDFILPRFKLNKRIEEQVPMVAKILGYPFNINKSSLQSVITPRTWSTLLGLLCWMTQLNDYVKQVDCEKIIFPLKGDDFDCGSLDMYIFGHIDLCYTKYLDGFTEYKEEEKVFASIFLNSDQDSKIKTMEFEIGRLEEQLKLLSNGPDRLTTLKRQMSEVECDHLKSLDYLCCLNENLKLLENKISQLSSDKECLDLENQDVLQTISNKQTIIQSQAFSAADVENMLKDQERKKQAIVSLDNDIKQIENQQWEFEIKTSKFHDEARSLCSEYNKLAYKYRLIPSTAENSNGLDLELKPIKMENYNHYVDVIKPTLIQFRQQYKDKSRSLEEEKLQLVVNGEKISEICETTSQRLADMNQVIKQLDEEFDLKKDTFSFEIQSFKTELESVKAEISDREALASSKINDLRLNQRELEKELLAEKKSHERTQEKASKFLQQTQNKIAAHKQELWLITQANLNTAQKWHEESVRDQQLEHFL